jgi:outer membrane protein OmpA-like peptidoglycan-associated protein
MLAGPESASSKGPAPIPTITGETVNACNVSTPLGVALLLSATLAPVALQAREGLYLGVQGGINDLDDQKFRIFNAQPGFLGTGQIPDGTVISTVGFDYGYVGGLVGGYAFGNGLRLELDLAQRENDFDDQDDLGTASVDTGSARTRARSVMGNLWLDLFPENPIRPYVGAGYGLVQIAIKDSTYQGSDLRKQDDDVNGYQLGAGVEFDLAPQWGLSLDYRFLDTGKGRYQFVENTTNTRVEADYQAQSLMLTLRYWFEGPEAVEPVDVPAPDPAPVNVVPVAAPADSDGDGITDDLDQCPDTPVGVKVNGVGCPLPQCKAPEPGQAVSLDGCATGDVIVLRGVNFEFNQARLTANAQALLDGVADSLTRASSLTVELGGHTDGKGTDEYNRKLSERRANSVRQYLVGKGIDPDRMTAVGYGEGQPVADNQTEIGRAHV